MEQDEFPKGGFNSNAPERLAVPVPYVNPFIIWYLLAIAFSVHLQFSV
jgi:hypothetical protein